MRVRAGGPLLLAVVVGCAQPGSPPGGEVDRTPPRVVEVVPAAFDTLRDLDARVVVRFDERISERLQDVRNWEDAVLVSPATSPVRVRAGRRTLEISLVRDWEPDRVYRVVVRPVFRDLFGNPRLEPIDLVFSTGAPFSDAALAGFVTDRLTARPLADARVEAVARDDGSRFVALSDSAGFFAMPYLPAGAYDLRGWTDQNRDWKADFFEIQDSAQVEFAPGDTTVVELALLRPDTTPARLARATPIDSAKVRLLFDDYFAVGPVDGEATLHALPDSVLIGGGRLVHGSSLDSILAVEAGAAAALEAARAATDSLAPDSLPAAEARAGQPDEPAAVDEAAAGAGRPGRPGQEGAGRGRAGAGRTAGPPLPSQELILLAPVLLRPDSGYYVTVRGVTNIQGIPGGGGTAAFVMPPPPAPGDTVPADTVPGEPTPGDTIPPGTTAP